MRWHCPHCKDIFESETPPQRCPLCRAGATARKRFPSKRKTHKQIRAIVKAQQPGKLTLEKVREHMSAVVALSTEQGIVQPLHSKVFSLKDAEPASAPEGHIHGEVTIKL